MAKSKKLDCIDCWSPAERGVKAAFENFKGMVFYPVVVILRKLGVPVDFVSYGSLVVGLVATVYMWSDLKIAGMLLFLSLLLDGIDGSLARATNRGGARGAVMDCFIDQVVISASMIGFVAVGIVNVVIGGVYLVVYPLMIVFSILRNIIKSPRVYVFRPRVYVYVAFWIYVFGGVNLLNYVVGVAMVTLLFQVVLDFCFLRGQLE